MDLLLVISRVVVHGYCCNFFSLSQSRYPVNSHLRTIFSTIQKNLITPQLIEYAYRLRRALFDGSLAASGSDRQLKLNLFGYFDKRRNSSLRHVLSESLLSQFKYC